MLFQLFITCQNKIDHCLSQVILAEKGNPENVNSRILEEVELGLPNWKEFLEFYQDWLHQTQMEMPGSIN